MEYKKVPCKVITTFRTYEECAEYMMKNQNENQMKRACRFEKYFVQVLREHPVLYDENHRQFGKKFPTKHAWSIVAGYMMMKRAEVEEAWKTFQKLASSGVQLYVDLVNYVKLGDGNGWIDVDFESDSCESGGNEGNSSVTQEDKGNVCVKEEESFPVKEEVVSPVKMEME